MTLLLTICLIHPLVVLLIQELSCILVARKVRNFFLFFCPPCVFRMHIYPQRSCLPVASIISRVTGS